MIDIDIQKIKEDFNKVIMFSQDIPCVNSDDLFEQWYNAKKGFIEKFGGLIYQTKEPVCLTLSEEEKMDKLDTFIDKVRADCQPALANFLEENKEGFYENKVVENFQYSSDITIPAGMKLIKAFKYFFGDLDDPWDLERYQQMASMIIQENVIEGYLCVSVHPLDFLSLSENTHNWRSCHSLDGDYRAGNLSYMVDNTTFICYLKSKNDVVLPHFPAEVKWNSKKWRVLMFLADTENMLIASRQYPFNSMSGLEYLVDKIFPAANIGYFSSWMTKKFNCITENRTCINFPSYYIPVPHHGFVLLTDMVHAAPGSLNYNDVLTSDHYKLIYCFKRPNNSFKETIVTSFDENDFSINRFQVRTKEVERDYKQRHTTFSKFLSYQKKVPTFDIGGKVKCLCCGDASAELSESVMCPHCEVLYGPCEDEDVFSVCPSCGQKYVFDEGHYVEDSDENVCPYCYENYVIQCDKCGIEMLSYNCYDEVIDKKTKILYNNVCKECYYNMEKGEQ